MIVQKCDDLFLKPVSQLALVFDAVIFCHVMLQVAGPEPEFH